MGKELKAPALLQKTALWIHPKAFFGCLKPPFMRWGEPPLSDAAAFHEGVAPDGFLMSWRWKNNSRGKNTERPGPPSPSLIFSVTFRPPPLFSRSERHRARGTLDLRLDLNPECVQRQLGVFLKADYQGGGRTFAGVSAKFLALSFYSSFLMCYMETPHFSLWDENTNYYVPPSLKCHKLWNSTEPHLHLLHIWILFFAQSIWTKSEIQLTSWVFCEWAPIKQLLLGDNKGLSQNRSFFPSCAKKKRNKVANRQKWVSSFFGAVGCFVRGESCSLCSNGWRA